MSAKDKMLCWVTPHLVLDGVALAAESVGATEVIVCIDRNATRSIHSLQRAMEQRAARGPSCAAAARNLAQQVHRR